MGTSGRHDEISPPYHRRLYAVQTTTLETTTLDHLALPPITYSTDNCHLACQNKHYQNYLYFGCLSTTDFPLQQTFLQYTLCHNSFAFDFYYTNTPYYNFNKREYIILSFQLRRHKSYTIDERHDDYYISFNNSNHRQSR